MINKFIFREILKHEIFSCIKEVIREKHLCNISYPPVSSVTSRFPPSKKKSQAWARGETSSGKKSQGSKRDRAAREAKRNWTARLISNELKRKKKALGRFMTSWCKPGKILNFGLNYEKGQYKTKKHAYNYTTRYIITLKETEKKVQKFWILITKLS